ncbi:uncharacterized protein MONOS_17893 [Monocercomonoides exilis]|uniref:uncharacterized protein n=1 Tax=Monocercomonoides exilis TaxID=2049356 RepID=UPI0035595132|nr:hypothetical protein MONOS_17893 [Monocercomonoides exilis]
MQVILEREAADFFGSVLSYKIFDIPIDKRDVAETIEFYNSIPLAPFIPSSIRKHEFTAKWALDALCQVGERIEKKPFQTIKSFQFVGDSAREDSRIPIEDALSFLTITKKKLLNEHNRYPHTGAASEAVRVGEYHREGGFFWERIMQSPTND